MGESVDHLQIAVAIVDHEEAKESVQAEINVKRRHETEVKEWVVVTLQRDLISKPR